MEHALTKKHYELAKESLVFILTDEKTYKVPDYNILFLERKYEAYIPELLFLFKYEGEIDVTRVLIEDFKAKSGLFIKV